MLPLLLLAIAGAAFSAPRFATPIPQALQRDTTPAFELKQYWLVFLLRGDSTRLDSATAAQIQRGHLENIGRLAREGKIIMAGPMGYDRELRGIFIMDGKDSATVASYVATDPAVRAGRLRFEIHPWWTEKGTYIFE